jgi:hypothetical protein
VGVYGHKPYRDKKLSVSLCAFSCAAETKQWAGAHFKSRFALEDKYDAAIIDLRTVTRFATAYNALVMLASTFGWIARIS